MVNIALVVLMQNNAVRRTAVTIQKKSKFFVEFTGKVC